VVTWGRSGRRWLSRPEPDIAEAVSCLDHVVTNANRAVDVIARVRALARKSVPQAEPLNLADLVDEAVALVEREAQAAGVMVRHNQDGAVPSALGDRVQVQQVIVNLLMNGIQAMREVDGRPRELCVALRRDDDGAVQVAVQDCGTGIDGDPAQIFEPFFTTKADGMGIGLSICRSIIQTQGGRISAANNPDHGATIAFTLPACADPGRAAD
jgi:C4-dicarboxylate-specific signal transduction histidine kinase